MIFRELVTKLSFKLDRTQLDKFEKAISGFKTTASTAFGKVAQEIRKVFEFADEIATAGVKVKDMAGYASLAVKDFVALSNAAQKFGIKEDTFNQSIQNLSILLKQASRGAGELFEIVRQSQGKVSFKKANGELKTTQELLVSIFEYVKSIPQQDEQLRILGNLFDVESSGRWLKIINESERFFEVVKNEKPFAKAFEDAVPEMEKFRLEIETTKREWQKFRTTIGQVIVPPLAQTLGGVNDIIDQGSKGNGAASILRGINDAFQIAGEDLFNWITGNGKDNSYIEAIKLDAARESYKMGVRLQRQMDAEKAANQTSITNNIEVNVPEGTTEQQGDYMAEKIKLTIQEAFFEQSREILNNHPQVE
jgi:hypothetical protein